jgi:hypothetical protein
MLQTHFHHVAAVGLIILFCPMLFVNFMDHTVEVASKQLGFVCSLMSVCVYISPMASLVREIYLCKNLLI